jgi:hypothetical protein
VLVIVLVSATRTWTPILDPTVPLAAPLLGAVTGLLAGMYPSLRAASLEPVDALRGGRAENVAQHDDKECHYDHQEGQPGHSATNCVADSLQQRYDGRWRSAHSKLAGPGINVARTRAL